MLHTNFDRSSQAYRRPAEQSAESYWLGLFYGDARRPLAIVVPDPNHRGMYRVRRADGTLTDMVNFARAKDAAAAIAERGPPARDAKRFRRDRLETLEGARTAVSRRTPLSSYPTLSASVAADCHAERARWL